MIRNPFGLISALRRSYKNWMAAILLFALSSGCPLHVRLREHGLSVFMTPGDALILTHLLTWIFASKSDMTFQSFFRLSQS